MSKGQLDPDGNAPADLQQDFQSVQSVVSRLFWTPQTSQCRMRRRVSSPILNQPVAISKTGSLMRSDMAFISERLFAKSMAGIRSAKERLLVHLLSSCVTDERDPRA